MLGLELVKDRETKVPARADEIGGILVGKAGAYNNGFRLGPPLTLSINQAKRVLLALEKTFQ